MNKKNALYSILTLLFANPAYAALDCKTQPTCAELGYSLKELKGCESYLTCPFDNTYKKCIGTPFKYESCEDAGYWSDDTNRSCESSTKLIYLTNGETAECYASCSCISNYIENEEGQCVRAYESCEDAGYYSNDTNRDCSETPQIYLTNGQKKQCYAACSCLNGYLLREGECIRAYESCEDAGYFSDDANRNCNSSTTTIYLITTGQQTSCYTGCSCIVGEPDADGNCPSTYETCEDAGLHTIEDGMVCSSTANIYLTDGSYVTCCSTTDFECDDGYMKISNKCYKYTSELRACDSDFQNCDQMCHENEPGLTPDYCGKCYDEYQQCFGSACSTFCGDNFSSPVDVYDCVNQCNEYSLWKD